MKKRLFLIPLIAILVLSGCSNKDINNNVQDTEEFGEIAVDNTELSKNDSDKSTKSNSSSNSDEYSKKDINDFVTIGEYKHVVDITSDNITVSEEEIEQQLQDYINDNNSEQISGTVKDGDTINVNYSIAVNDNTMSYDDIDISIGTDTIAPGIDEKLIGQKTGYIGDFNIVYPEDYFDANMIGKQATINVTINYICQDSSNLELSDEMVQTISDGKYKSVDDLKSGLKETLETQKKSLYYYLIIEKIKENTVVTGDISSYVDNEYQKSLQEYEDYCITYNTTMDNVAETYGYDDEDAFKEYLKTLAEDAVKEKLIIYKFSNDFNISVSDDEYDEYVDNLKEQYTEDEINSLYSEGDIKYNILYQKVLDKLVDYQLN